jgi:hypothetical protein
VNEEIEWFKRFAKVYLLWSHHSGRGNEKEIARAIRDVAKRGYWTGNTASPSPIPEAPVVREEIKKILYSYHGATLSADEAADRIIRALKPQDGGDVVANEDISTNPAPLLHAFKPRNGGESGR